MQGEALLKKPIILPDKFDGTVGWQDYHAHFELCADLNGWTPRQKASYLAVSLRGPAQELLGDMTLEMRQNYFILVDNLSSRFGSEGQTELFRVQLKTRRRKANESLPELSQAIRRLVTRAYPSAPMSLKETLSIENFIDALNDMETRLRLKQSKLLTLDETVRMAIELEAFQQAENEKFPGKNKKFVHSTKPSENLDHKQLTEKIENLEKQLQKLLEQSNNEVRKHQQNGSVKSSNKKFKKRTPFNLDEIDCWNCGKLGHFQANCPEGKQSKSKSTNANQNQET